MKIEFVKTRRKDLISRRHLTWMNKRFSVETHGVELTGQDAIRGMFERLWSNHAAVQHDNFRFIVDVAHGKIAAQFRVTNTFENGDKVYKSNCNFFTVRDSFFDTVAVYMAGENTLDRAE